MFKCDKRNKMKHISKNFSGDLDCELHYNYTMAKLRRYIEFSALTPNESDRGAFVVINDTPKTLFATTNSPMNVTQIEYPKFDFRAQVIVIAYSCLFTVAVIGNVTVFVNLFRSRKRKSCISFLIIHLTIADLIVTLIMIPFEIAWRFTVQWLGGNVACKILLFFRAFGLYLSSNVLICISLDRYFAVVHPLMVSNKRSRGKWMLSCAWFASSVYAFPQLFIFHVERHPHFSNFTQCVSFDYFSSPRHEFLYNMGCLIVMYFLPLIIIVVTYSSILWKMWRKARHSKGDQDATRASNALDLRPPSLDKHSEGKRSSNTKDSHINETSFSQERNQVRKHRDHVVLRRSDMKCIERARIRTLKMTAVIVVVFLVCWTPYVVMAMWYMFDRQSAQDVPTWLQDGLFMMAVSNSCMNPLVYGRYTVQTVAGNVNDVKSKWGLFCCFPCLFRKQKPTIIINEPRVISKRRQCGGNRQLLEPMPYCNNGGIDRKCGTVQIKRLGTNRIVHTGIVDNKKCISDGGGAASIPILKDHTSLVSHSAPALQCVPPHWSERRAESIYKSDYRHEQELSSGRSDRNSADSRSSKSKNTKSVRIVENKGRSARSSEY